MINQTKLRAEIISDAKSFRKIENRWNVFIEKNNKAPFLLSGFINQWLEHEITQLKPYFLIFFNDDEIVGVAPLGIRDIGFGFRYCRLLMGEDFQPEIIFMESYRDDCIRSMHDFLFKKMNCKFIDLFYPIGHLDLPALRRLSKDCGVHCSTSVALFHSVLRLDRTKNDKISRNLRRQFERTHRRMSEMGQLQIQWFGRNSSSVAFQKILAVERMSWKEAYRLRIGLSVDPVLSCILDGCIETASKVKEFNWEVAVLELNREPIAYNLLVNYQGIVYCCKTSFDNCYRKQGAGIYINHVVVQELKKRPDVQVIDFLTNLPFSHKWASEVVPTYRVRLWQNGLVQFLFRKTVSSRLFKNATDNMGKASAVTRMLIGLFYK